VNITSVFALPVVPSENVYRRLGHMISELRGELEFTCTATFLGKQKIKFRRRFFLVDSTNTDIKKESSSLSLTSVSTFLSHDLSIAENFLLSGR